MVPVENGGKFEWVRRPLVSMEALNKACEQAAGFLEPHKPHTCIIKVWGTECEPGDPGHLC
jgi:hypothetical protein